MEGKLIKAIANVYVEDICNIQLNNKVYIEDKKQRIIQGARSLPLYLMSSLIKG